MRRSRGKRAAFDFDQANFGKISVAGTLLFIVSDSIPANNRFALPIDDAPVFVMSTYGAAQFLITEGSLRNLREIKNQPQLTRIARIEFNKIIRAISYYSRLKNQLFAASDFVQTS